MCAHNPAIIRSQNCAPSPQPSAAQVDEAQAGSARRANVRRALYSLPSCTRAARKEHSYREPQLSIARASIPATAGSQTC